MFHNFLTRANLQQPTRLFSSSLLQRSRLGLGLLCIDREWELQTGDIKHKDTFDFPVVNRTVRGLTFDMCMTGIMTPKVKEEFCQAVQEMDNHPEVTGISGDCGFMMYFQKMTSQITRKPVFMSPLVQLPMLAMTCAHRDEFIIMTSNGKQLQNMTSFLSNNVALDTDRYHIVGCENIDGFEAVAAGGFLDGVKVEPSIVSVAK